MKTIDNLHLLQPGNVKARKSLNNTCRVLLYTSLHWEWPGRKDRKDPAELCMLKNTLTSLRGRHCAGEEVWITDLYKPSSPVPKRIFYPSRHSTLYPYSFLNPLPFTFCPHHCSRVPFSQVGKGLSPTKSYWQPQLFTHSEAVDMMIFYPLTC